VSNLVFLASNDMNEEPFTTSKVIAECGGVQHHTVTRIIKKYVNDIEEFGPVDFKSIGINGTSDYEKVYHLIKLN
jgi:phage regulator Rha-like protein